MVTYRILRNSELIEQTLARIFGEGVHPLGFVDWFKMHPEGPTLWYAAMSGEEPIGLYGLQQITVCAKGHMHRGALCHNVGVVPEWRGRGVFTGLGRYALKHLAPTVAIGIPNDAAVPGHKRVGWRTVGKLVLLRGPGYPVSIKSELFEDPAKFGDVIPYMPNGFYVHRPLDWSLWRYNRPGVDYRCWRNGTDRVVWKMHEGRTQILESSSLAMTLMAGRTIDVWALEGSDMYDFFVKQGFDLVFTRNMILYGEPVEKGISLSAYRFELCDNDVF